MASDHARNVVIQVARKIVSVVGLGPIAEHHGHSREHLQGHPARITLFDSLRWVPTIALNLSEELAIISKHPGPTRSMMIERDESAVAVALSKLRQIARQDVRMDIDLSHSPLSSHADARIGGTA